MTKTTFATAKDHDDAMAKWVVVDASKYVLGRMATVVAEVLMGKHTPLYTPHVNVGHGVIVINAENVVVTGAKRDTRVYTRWTGYPGGLREATLGDRLEDDPEDLIKRAVRRMLPKTRLGKQMLSRLKVYRDANHPHAAQRPEELEIPNAKA